MTTPPAVEVRDLSITRGAVRAVVNVSVELPAGTITGLLGPSGSGKTTLMRGIVGSQRLTSGSITVLGEPAGSAAIRQSIGYMSQSPALYLDLTVLENLRYFAAILRLPPVRVEEVVALVDLQDRATAMVRTLSGGEMNRASLAVALLARPPVLILDEPTVGLDPLLRESLWSTFRSLADQGACLLVSSHVMDEASRCDRIVLLRDGAVLFEGPNEDLLRTAGADDIEGAFIALARRPRP